MVPIGGLSEYAKSGLPTGSPAICSRWFLSRLLPNCPSNGEIREGHDSDMTTGFTSVSWLRPHSNAKSISPRMR